MFFLAGKIPPWPGFDPWLSLISINLILGLTALNFYWLIPVLKNTYKKVSGLFKPKSDKASKKKECNKESNVDKLIEEINIDEYDEDVNEEAIKEEAIKEEAIKEEEIKEEEIKEEEIKEEAIKEEEIKEEIKS